MSQTKSTRRGFLKRSAGVVAAGAAAPYVWTSSYAKGQESANDKLNVAAIGVGGQGSGIGGQAGGLGNMVACADVHRTNAEKFAGRYRGKCKIYSDYRKILDRKDIDAITCGTPDHWHTKISIDAMKAGKDVYCEKPLTLTMAESRLICQVTKETGRVFQIGTQQRSENADRFLKAVVIARSGRLGKKLHAISSVGGADSNPSIWPTQDPPEYLDWDFWLGQTPKVDYCPNRLGWNFRWWLEYSGGQVTDWGVHHTDIALWAVDGQDTGVIEAEGTGDFAGLPADVNIFDFLNGKVKIPNRYNVARTFDCDMKLPNGNTIKLFSGGNELIISGEKGRIRVNRGSLTGKPVEEIEKSPSDKEWLAEEVDKLYSGPRHGHMGNFFDCIKTGKKPISDVWTHCNSVDACHMANIAMLLKRKVRFDPEKREFIGDEEANALMSRKQRKPYAIKV